jgi:ABC-type branched-subunit amino acid transport system substrate-binding protein
MNIKMIMAGVALGLFSVPAQADIKIGLTGALTGPLAGTYAPAVEGLRLYIEEVNASGGINGESIELILQDDGMEPSRAAANSKRLMTQDNVVLMINSSLSSTYAPTINEAKRAGVPLLFAASACPKEVFPPADKNLFCSTGFGPSYDSQAALGFVKATAGTDVKIGFHAMTIPISRGEIDYAEKLSGDMGMTPVAKEISPPPTPDYSPFAANIKNAGAEWVWSWAPWIGQVKTFEALRRQGWDGTFLTYSHLEAEGELARLKDENFYVIGANAMSYEDMPVLKEMSNAARAANSKYSAGEMMEGWIAGMVVEAALMAASDPKDSDAVREAMSSINVDTKGLRGGNLQWTSDNHFRTQQSYRVYHWNKSSGKINMAQDWLTFDVN